VRSLRPDPEREGQIGALGVRARARRYVSPFLWLCIMGGLAIFSTTMSKNPALPLFIQALGVNPGELGFIAAASTVVGIVVSLPAGMLSDVWGRRRVILLSMIVFATAPFLYLFVTAPWQLVLVRVYHGLATAILGPVAMATVADTFQEGRGERMGWYSSATMIGRFLAPSVGGLLIFGNDFRWVYLGCGVAGCLALLAATNLPSQPRLPKASPQHAGRSPGRGWAEMRRELHVLLTNRDILLTSLMEASQYFAFGAVETFLPLYLVGLGLQPREIGPLFTLQVVITTLARPLMGRVSDRWGRKWQISLGLLVSAGAALALPRLSSYWLLMILIGLFGLGVAMVTASTSALVSDLSRATAYGSAQGVLSSVMDIGHSTGPMVTGLVVAAWGYRPAFALAAGLLVAFALLFHALVREPESG
jgi:DHA1 family multidrug resistance protein-like MFS transporter